jgi:hypothetical protein
MATFATIRSAINTKLQTVVGTGKPLVAAYDYHEANLPGYPSATFALSDNDGEFLTNRDNLRTYTYQIFIYQEITVAGLDTAEGILDTAADAVIAAFEADQTLGGVVDWCRPMTGSRQTFETPQGLVRVQQLALRCLYEVRPA